MAIFHRVLIMMPFLMCPPVFAGGVVKGGGGFVTCGRIISDTEFRLSWSTDFLITGESQDDIALPWREQEPIPHGGIIVGTPWRYLFSEMLEAKLPAQANEWYRQINSMFPGEEHTEPSLFQRGSLQESEWPELREIQPEILSSLPAECPNVQMHLLILRVESSDGLIKYLYNQNLIDSGLPFLNELQLSFLIVHEWLWNFTRDPVAVRNANRYLHSQEFYDSSPQDAIHKLEQIGLNIRKFDRFSL